MVFQTPKFKRDILYVIPSVNVITFSKKTQQISKICTRRELLPPSLTRTIVVSHSPPCHPSALSSVFHMFEVCACTVLSV